MRLALLSDIHGNLAALEAVVEDLRRHAVDVVAVLGDNLSGPLLPRETAQYLAASGWVTLAGNHERQLLTEKPEEQGASDAYATSQLGAEEFAWLKTLPATKWLSEAGAEGVFLCHGTPQTDLVYLLEDIDHGRLVLAGASAVETRLGGLKAGLVACGHSHVARVVRSQDSVVVNPGSVGLPAFRSDQPTPHIAEAGAPLASYAVAELSRSGWRACLRGVPYHHEAMARLADAHGRPDWAVALRTGRAPPV